MAQSYQGHESLSHSKRDCKSPVGFISKRRGQAFFGRGRRHLGEVFQALARQKEGQIIEGSLILTPIDI